MVERHIPQPEEEAGNNLPLPDLEWQTVPFSEVSKNPIQPGQVIEGVPTISAFDSIERQLFLTLLRTAHPDEEIKTPRVNWRITDDGISKQLRPEKFYGNVQNGKAIVLPFDAELVTRYQSILPKKERQSIQDAETIGLRVIYQGDLVRSTKQTHVGMMLQDAVYFYNRSLATDPNVEHLRRVLGPTTNRDSSTQVMEDIVGSSAQTARASAGRAFRDAFRASAGSPGLGKRR